LAGNNPPNDKKGNTLSFPNHGLQEARLGEKEFGEAAASCRARKGNFLPKRQNDRLIFFRFPRFGLFSVL
jgi:hypothetical protein